MRRLISPLFLLLAACIPHLASASDFRISFLEQPSTLDETCSQMKKAGIPELPRLIFQRLVLWQNQGGNGVDTGKFPVPTNGTYLFHGIQDFTNRTSHVFADSKGKPTFMCFDAACLLLYSAGVRADSVDSNFDSKDVINVTPERKLSTVSYQELTSDPNILISPNDYRALTGQSRSDAETKLGLSLHVGRRLTPGTTNTDSFLRAAFNRFLADIRQDGFSFPTNFDLGMVFYVDTKRGFIQTDHAFLCIPEGRHLTILEKDNSPGPYVRGDFYAESDLAQYVCLAERGDINNPNDVDFGSSVLVSLNDRLIGIFRPAASK